MKLNTKLKTLSIYSVLSLVLTFLFINTYPFFIGKNIDFFEDHERHLIKILVPKKNISWKLIQNTNNYIVQDYNPAVGEITFEPQGIIDIVNKINDEQLLSFDKEGQANEWR